MWTLNLKAMISKDIFNVSTKTFNAAAANCEPNLAIQRTMMLAAPVNSDQ